MLENRITGDFIRRAFVELEDNGWLEGRGGGDDSGGDGDGGSLEPRFFVRRLRHLQHICQTFEGTLSESANVIGESRLLIQCFRKD